MRFFSMRAFASGSSSKSSSMKVRVERRGSGMSAKSLPSTPGSTWASCTAASTSTPIAEARRRAGSTVTTRVR